MVRNVKYLSKYAFTMIELIFAIVIIAISVISLPMISQVTSVSIERNIAQEAIFSAIAEINIATAYIWDENSIIEAIDLYEPSRVIDNGDCVNTAGINRRTGHVNRRCLNDLAIGYTGAAGPFQYSLDWSIHDYNITIDDNSSAATTSATGYKKEYESELDVERCNSGNCEDFGILADVNNPDMKEIKVTIRDKDENATVTILRAYSANIGEVNYHSTTDDTINYPGGTL